MLIVSVIILCVLPQMEKYGVFVECKAGSWGAFGECTKACGKGTVCRPRQSPLVAASVALAWSRSRSVPFYFPQSL